MFHPVDNPRIEEFSQLLKESKWFDDVEIRIIAALLKIKESSGIIQCSANDISKHANISVTNAYKYLYGLQEKGIIESGIFNDQKTFWLTCSTNPFPRILSYIGQDYLSKKKLFSEIEKTYNFLKPNGEIWQGQKIHEHYEDNFVKRASVLFDMAKKEILITTEKFFEDFILLDALKRAVTRGVNVKIITEEIEPQMGKSLKDINIELRLGYGWPYVIISDGLHGMTLDGNNKGIWFLNHPNEYSQKFSGFWEKSRKI